MSIGIIINVLSVVIGGILGTLVGKRLRPDFIAKMNMVFACCSLGMGISSVVLMENMPAVILAVVLGSAIGLMCHLGDLINKGGELLQKPITKIMGRPQGMSHEDFSSLLVTTIVLFCASGTGIYGCLDAGITGDNTILFSKSILDLFTALIFACNLGAVVSMIAIPQIVVFTVMFNAAQAIVPLTNDIMISDFKACCGIVLIATGLRIAKIKEFPIADMIPAMVLVMPFSAMWVNYIVPML